jgi:hypothetical protein
MTTHVTSDRSSRAFYHEVLATLVHADVPFLVGGGVALARYAGVKRGVEALDLFMRRDDWPGAATLLNHVGIDTHLAFSHWLAKACEGEWTVQIMYNGGNGLTPVDARWFDCAPSDEVVGVKVRLCPPEEMIWSKAFVMERERFDGADILHLIRARHDGLNWDRLLELFEPYPRVLFAHLVLFGFVYPGGTDKVPPWVLAHLWSQVGEEGRHASSALCRGTVLSRGQYLVDVEHWGYADARMFPFGTMTRTEIEQWTHAMDPAQAIECSDVRGVWPPGTER